MELQEAIARHRRARARMDDYKAGRMEIDEATFTELNEESFAALISVIDAPEEGEDGFFEKLRYLTEFEASKMHYAPPAIWQINGSILVVLWR